MILSRTEIQQFDNFICERGLNDSHKALTRI